MTATRLLTATKVHNTHQATPSAKKEIKILPPAKLDEVQEVLLISIILDSGNSLVDYKYIVF